ncbi:MAG: hypothetical protein ACYCSI_15940 [Solirubrobacteraceae bacterium]
MHAASIVDTQGSFVADVHESYWHRATGGRYPPADLALGQALLVDVGLVIEDGADCIRPPNSKSCSLELPTTRSPH